MFEQSVLGDHHSARKSIAFFFSIAAQIAATGVLVIVPIIFHQALPALRLSMPLVLPLSQPPLAPAAVRATSSVEASRAVPRVFRAPARILPLTTPALEPYVDSTVPSISVGSTPDGIERLPVIPAITTPNFEKPPQPLAPAVPSPKPPRGAIHVGGDVQAAKLLKRILPVYPAPAREARISGTVRLLGVIAKDGTVQKLQVVSGNPLLVRAAIDAVGQWLYKPTVLDGEPVEVIAPIDVIFTLSR